MIPCTATTTGISTSAPKRKIDSRPPSTSTSLRLISTSSSIAAPSLTARAQTAQSDRRRRYESAPAAEARPVRPLRSRDFGNPRAGRGRPEESRDWRKAGLPLARQETRAEREGGPLTRLRATRSVIESRSRAISGANSKWCSSATALARVRAVGAPGHRRRELASTRTGSASVRSRLCDAWVSIAGHRLRELGSLRGRQSTRRPQRRPNRRRPRTRRPLDPRPYQAKSMRQRAAVSRRVTGTGKPLVAIGRRKPRSARSPKGSDSPARQ